MPTASTSSTPSTVLSSRDLEFLLFEWLDVERLGERPRFAEHDRSSYEALLALCEEIATEHFASHYRRSDTEEPTFDGEKVTLIPEIESALRTFARADLMALTVDEEDGGLQVPHVVAAACMAWFTAANIGTAAYAFLTVANARLLLEHGSPEQVERYVRPMLEGRFFGTMTLSEPQAGSSLGDVVTRAVPADDGTYRIFGSKMWISGGDHEMGDTIVHLVLAKLPDAPAGTRGISLFVVPKHLVADDGTVGERNDVALAGINHKLGNRGTVNTAPVFGGGAFTPGGAPGAVGYLVGEPHKGLSYMFHMMNAARLGVGMSATTTAYTAYLKSLAYARSRPQGRHLGAADPAGPQVPIIEHADVRRMLLAQKSYVEGALALNLYCSRLLDEQATATDDAERLAVGQLLDVLTPIAKSWPSQWGQESCSLAIQVLGGSGYTRDFDVEAHWRDQRLNPIHEGTHGIQALDLLGRKVLGGGGASLLALAGRIGDTAARAADLGGEPAEHAAALQAVVGRLGEVTLALGGLGDPARTLANATVYLEAAGHVVVAWMWLEQLVAVGDREGDFYDGKRAAARYFFRWELPKVGAMLDLLAAGDTTTLDMQPGWF
ncbi:butyryl-CoA dehydrogenase [Nocardioides cavernae]|uniref:Butyryl-CoA dehydrogenase n=1 Tax=Nocardioides cavernae TaxID=1921566 RepID=A0A7Y9H0J1_9ACTN|nr:acyl-CoA dehydrogenase [Nocardioides cavernae]NYE35386.1 butyryl-CoA dehydrogenase [Nocardioides cavernae]